MVSHCYTEPHEAAENRAQGVLGVPVATAQGSVLC